MAAAIYGPERMQLNLKHSAAAEEAQIAMAAAADLHTETFDVASESFVETMHVIQKKVLCT